TLDQLAPGSSASLFPPSMMCVDGLKAAFFPASGPSLAPHVLSGKTTHCVGVPQPAGRSEKANLAQFFKNINEVGTCGDLSAQLMLVSRIWKRCLILGNRLHPSFAKQRHS